MSSRNSADNPVVKKSLSIKTAPRILWASLAIIAIAMLVGAAMFAATRQGVGCGLSIPAQQPSKLDFAGSGQPRDCIYLEQVNDPAGRAVGLAKYDSLPLTQGMLFVFEPHSQACMWMKDMQFAIDMVWLDPDRRVIKIEKSVPPDSYPTSFCSEQPAQYVIELAAGVADKAGLKVGQQITL